MAERIRVLLVEPMKKPKVVEVKNTLERLQELVGGYLEVVYSSTDPTVLVCNEEAKLTGCAPNRVLVDSDGHPYDLVCGPFFIAGIGLDDFKSLSDDLVKEYAEMFRYPERILLTLDGRLLWERVGSGQPPKMGRLIEEMRGPGGRRIP